jgi:hypothetical protein
MSVAMSVAILWVCQVGAQDPAGKDKPTLAWSFAKGQEIEMKWKIQMRVDSLLDGKEAPRTDVTMTFIAKFVVGEVKEDGSATGELHQRNWVVQGRFQGGEEMDIVIEDGQLKKPAAPQPENVKRLLATMLAPVKARVTATGNFEPDQASPMFATFGGEGVILGPTLPGKPVAPGDVWTTTFRLGQAPRAGAPEIKLKHTLVEISETEGRKCARIKVDEKQKASFQGLDADFTIKIDALFDVNRKECFRSTYTNDFVSSGDFRGQKLEMTGHSKLEFEAGPQRK